MKGYTLVPKVLDAQSGSEDILGKLVEDEDLPNGGAWSRCWQLLSRGRGVVGREGDIEVEKVKECGGLAPKESVGRDDVAHGGGGMVGRRKGERRVKWSSEGGRLTGSTERADDPLSP